MLKLGRELTAKVIKADHVVFDAERVQEVEDGLCHHWRTAEVVLTVFGCLMSLEVGVAHNGSHEARCVLDTCCICLRIGTVESEVEVEVGEVLLELQEVIEERNLLQRAGTIEIVHGALTVFILHTVTLQHMHDLSTQRSHTGTTTDPNHLTTCAVLRTELTIGAAHDDLITGLQAKDVAGSNTRVDIHETRTLLLRLEGRCGDTDVEGDDVALVGVVGHGVSADGGFGVLTLEREEAELLPCGQVSVADEGLVEVLIVIDAVEGRNANLSVATRLEVHVLSGRQSDLVLLDEGGDVLVANNGALPFLDTEDAVGDLDSKVALYLALTAKTPVILDFLAGEVALLGIENLATALYDLALTLAAGALTTASRGEIYSFGSEGGEQAGTLRHGQRVLAVHCYCDITTRREVSLSDKQNDDQRDDNHEENHNACEN